MKLIFLDIDGVMNHRNYMVKSRLHIMQEFCPSAVRNLREIVKRTGAKIVVSSTWRHGGMDEMRKILSCYDLDSYLIGLTPYLPDEIRGNEILDYIRKHELEIEDYIILDNDADMGPLMHRLIQCKDYSGLTDARREQAIQMLGEG